MVKDYIHSFFTICHLFFIAAGHTISYLKALTSDLITLKPFLSNVTLIAL